MLRHLWSRPVELFVASALAASLTGCGTSAETDDVAGDGGTGDASSGGTSGGSDPGTPSGSVCERTERLGSFVLTLADSYTAFRGAYSDGVAVNAVPELIGSAGGCDLLGPQDLFCATPCESGQICAGNDQCVPAATKVSAGTITLTGLEKDVTLEANGITSDYSSNFDEPYPGFLPGAAIGLSATGDSAAGFTLSGQGVGAMTSTLETVDITSGEDVLLSWDASGATSESQLSVLLTVNAHGGTSAWIECVAPDSGAFSIPGELVDQLIGLGLSGFPRITLSRQTLDSTEVDGGCVDFTVGSDVTLPVSIDGLVSCNTDDECPDGQTCSAFLACE